MAEFYDEMTIVAAELINEFGRELTLVKESRTPADPDKPWRGTDDAGAVSVTVKGAVVGFDDDLVDGDMIRRGDLDARSEEHTSELQSRENLVCRLVLGKKKTKAYDH